MTAPIDRIENVRAQVADVERQMEACRVAGVQFSPKMTWQLLSACKSLLGATLEAERAEARQQGAREAAGIDMDDFVDVASVVLHDEQPDSHHTGGPADCVVSAVGVFQALIDAGLVVDTGPQPMQPRLARQEAER